MKVALMSIFYRNIFHGLLILVFVNVIDAQVPGFGQCPRIQVMTQFDPSSFLGTWYGICSYPDKLAFDAKCSSATFTWAQNQADGMSIFSRHVSFGKEKKFMGMAKIITAGVLGVEFPCCPKANAYYNILDTDYANYAVIFSCNNFYGLANGQNVWILGRRKVLEPQYVERAMQTLNMNGISKLLLKHVDQNCDNRNPYQNPGNPNGYQNQNGFQNPNGGPYGNSYDNSYGRPY